MCILLFPDTAIHKVAQCYRKETAEFPSHLSTMLLENYGTLSPDTRKSLVQNLVMLRNKDVITSIECVHPCHAKLRADRVAGS